MRSSDSTVYDRLDVVTKKNYHSFCVGGTLLLCFHSELIQSCLEDGLELSLKKSKLIFHLCDPRYVTFVVDCSKRACVLHGLS